MNQNILRAWIVVLALLVHVQLQSSSTSQTDLYFAYGSNMSSEFLCERLKNGDWTSDGWHKTGNLEGPFPEDLGTYMLHDYEFSYNLADTDSQTETAGNITKKIGSFVYGVLYKITKEQLQELDISEDAPENYRRIEVIVHRSQDNAREDVPACATAWAYVGNPKYLTTTINPDPEYVELLHSAAIKRRFPRDYIEQYLEQKVYR